MCGENNHSAELRLNGLASNHRRGWVGSIPFSPDQFRRTSETLLVVLDAEPLRWIVQSMECVVISSVSEAPCAFPEMCTLFSYDESL